MARLKIFQCHSARYPGRETFDTRQWHRPYEKVYRNRSLEQTRMRALGGSNLASVIHRAERRRIIFAEEKSALAKSIQRIAAFCGSCLTTCPRILIAPAT